MKIGNWKKIIPLFEGIEDADIDTCNLETMDWLDYMLLFLQLKILYIAYRKNVENAVECNLWGMKEKSFFEILQDLIECSDDVDYDTIIEGLEELRYTMWNPPEDEIYLNDALTDFDWQQVENRDSRLLERFNTYPNEIIQTDWKVIAGRLAKLLSNSNFQDYDEDDLTYYVQVVKFPWIYRALSEGNAEKINPEVVVMLEEELQKVGRQLCYWGEDSFYCIEIVITTPYSYEYVPSLCMPVILAMLEEMAREACLEAGISPAMKQEEDTATVA